MLLSAKARLPLLLAALLTVAGILAIAGGAPGVPVRVPAAGQPAEAPGSGRLPEGRHMEPVADALSEQATLAPGVELLVGPGRLACRRDNICTLRDEDDPHTVLVFGIGSLDNGQRRYLIDNGALAANPVAVRLIRRDMSGNAYEALQVIDSRTRDTIGLQ
ncbi:hypothetical protein [Lichenicoccus sp.]|uniref:hypothetical protein n=1 Tax=Lichenicoccus sp. TaxID=2781899 RepID=UPI003D0C18C3